MDDDDRYAQAQHDKQSDYACTITTRTVGAHPIIVGTLFDAVAERSNDDDGPFGVAAGDTCPYPTELTARMTPRARKGSESEAIIINVVLDA